MVWLELACGEATVEGGAERVNEPGVPAVSCQLPLPGVGILLPAGAAAPGLVDAQH